MNQEWAIRKTETSSELRLAWDNREARQDKFLFFFLVLFSVVWTSVTLFVTGMVFRGDFPFGLVQALGLVAWCVLAWLGVVAVRYTLLARYWCEWVAISQEFIICGQRGLLAPSPTCISIDAVSEITIGHCFDANDSESHESVVTLNVFHLTPKGRHQRRMVGYWLHPTLKESVFCDLQEFAKKHQISLTFRRH